MTQISRERIMIVSRDLHTSYLLQRFVRTSDRQVIAAVHSDDILSLARGEKPVAIVLEVDTPETRQIPVMICSWLDDSARGLAEGVDAYVRMPILYDEFGAALTALLPRDSHDQAL